MATVPGNSRDKPANVTCFLSAQSSSGPDVKIPTTDGPRDLSGFVLFFRLTNTEMYKHR